MSKLWNLLMLFLLGSLTAANAQNPDEVIRFMKENPEKAALYLIENGTTTVNYNSRQLMPLASTAKIIVAITLAQQMAANKLLSHTKIAGKELLQYYIPNTDGGAHPNWLKSIGKQPTDSVTLLEIAQGMIRFSSNANTEFLTDFLKLENINKNLKPLGLKEHEPLYYFTAAALMTCLKPNHIDAQDWIARLTAMPIAAYRKKCEEAHLRLKTDTNFIKSFDFNNLSGPIQKVWSDKLVRSTTENYAQLMQKVNSKTYFNPMVQSIIERILEWPMEYAGNKAVFNHLGQKGGSTAFVLTDAFYASKKDGNTLACAFFFNNLSATERTFIEQNFGIFEANIITDQGFRNKLKEFLK